MQVDPARGVHEAVEQVVCRIQVLEGAEVAVGGVGIARAPVVLQAEAGFPRMLQPVVTDAPVAGEGGQGAAVDVALLEGHFGFVIPAAELFRVALPERAHGDEAGVTQARAEGAVAVVLLVEEVEVGGRVERQPLGGEVGATEDAVIRRLGIEDLRLVPLVILEGHRTGGEQVEGPGVIDPAQLEGVKGARRVQPLERADQALVAVAEELAADRGAGAFLGVADLRVGLEHIEDVVALGAEHADFIRPAAADLAHILALDVELEPGGEGVAETEAEALQQPGRVLRSIDGAVEVEVVFARLEAHFFLKVEGQSAIEEGEGGIAAGGGGLGSRRGSGGRSGEGEGRRGQQEEGEPFHGVWVCGFPWLSGG